MYEYNGIVLNDKITFWKLHTGCFIIVLGRGDHLTNLEFTRYGVPVGGTPRGVNDGGIPILLETNRAEYVTDISAACVAMLQAQEGEAVDDSIPNPVSYRPRTRRTALQYSSPRTAEELDATEDTDTSF